MGQSSGLSLRTGTGATSGSPKSLALLPFHPQPMIGLSGCRSLGLREAISNSVCCLAVIQSFPVMNGRNPSAEVDKANSAEVALFHDSQHLALVRKLAHRIRQVGVSVVVF